MRFLFFVFGVPMMIMSFFQATDAIPFAQNTSLLVDGQEIVLSAQQQEDLKMQVASLFEGSHTLPSLAVMFENDFQQKIQEGTYVSLKFERPCEINDLLFDELVFEVVPEYQGFNLYRGNRGVFQGRCVYVDLVDKTMQPLWDFVQTISIDEKEVLEDAEPQILEDVQSQTVDDAQEHQVSNEEK